MASAADHAARIRWLSTLWAPQRADGGAWARWKSALVAASVFGQLPAIEASLARCNRTAAVAFGLKARLSRLLSHEPSLQQLAALMAVRGVRVVQLSRRNRVKQALAEYRRLHAGLGQFRAAADGGGGGGSDGGGGSADGAPSARRARALRGGGDRRPPLAPADGSRDAVPAETPASRVRGTAVRAPPRCAASPTSSSASTRCRSPPPPPPPPAPPPGSTTYRKATPDRRREAVSNYAELCAKYRKSDLAQCFTEPCPRRAGRAPTGRDRYLARGCT